MKTKLRYVGIKPEDGSFVIVTSDNPISPPDGTHVIKLRTISLKAAVRRYIKHNLPAALYLDDDGGNELEDLFVSTPYNGYKPRKELKYAKSRAHRLMKRDLAGNIVVRQI